MLLWDAEGANQRKRVCVKSGSHMPPTYLGHSRRHGLGQRCILEHLSPTQSVQGIDRQLACEKKNNKTK